MKHFGSLWTRLTPPQSKIQIGGGQNRKKGLRGGQKKKIALAFFGSSSRIVKHRVKMGSIKGRVSPFFDESFKKKKIGTKGP